MSKPCDFGMCDPVLCTDTKCVVIEGLTGGPLTCAPDPCNRSACDSKLCDVSTTGYHVNKSHNRVTVYKFDAGGKRIGVVEHRIHRSGLPRGTREIWAASILREHGFNV